MRIPEWLQDPMSIGRRRVMIIRRVYLLTSAMICVLLAIFGDPINYRFLLLCAALNFDTFRRTFYDKSI